jgi:hypothetical protein
MNNFSKFGKNNNNNNLCQNPSGTMVVGLHGGDFFNVYTNAIIIKF